MVISRHREKGGSTITRKFLDTIDDEGGDAVDKGWYDFEVIDARPAGEDSQVIFIDMKIVGGPDDGRVVSPTLYVPTDGQRGATFHFKKKIRAFGPQIVAANLGELADDEQVAALAEALIGGRGRASLDKQKKGKYEGNQELLETRPLGSEVEDEGSEPENITNASDVTSTPDERVDTPQETDVPF